MTVTDVDVSLETGAKLALLLYEMGDVDIIDSLEKSLLESQDARIRFSSAFILGEIRDPKSIDVLRKTLKQKTEEDHIRGEAAIALGKISVYLNSRDTVNTIIEDFVHVKRNTNAWHPLFDLVDEALVTLGPTAIDTLILYLADEEDEIRISIGKVLKLIGDQTLDPMVRALGHEDSKIRQGVEQALVWRLGGPEKVIELLEKRMQDEKKESSIYLHMTRTLERLKRNMEIRKSIERPRTAGGYGINVDPRFPLEAMEMLHSILKYLPSKKVVPSELVEGLNTITYTGDLIVGKAGDYIKHTKEVIIGKPTRMSFAHEIGHYVNDKYYNSQALKELHERSSIKKEDKLIDFAYDYGPEDRDSHDLAHDFTTTFELYMVDVVTEPGKTLGTKDQFIRGIQQAGRGKPIYLEKLFFVLNVFTDEYDKTTQRFKGKTARMYMTTDENKLIWKDIPVERDPNQNDKIIKIGGVNIYQTKPDGSFDFEQFNLNDLEKFFNELVI